MSLTHRPQSVRDTIERIEAGVDPWIAYRDFLEDWTYIPGARRQLAQAEPLVSDPRHFRWATLLAATVEALCDRDGLPVPDWALRASYHLDEPWYLYRGAARMRQWLHESTPEPFARRNIWSGDRILRRT